MIDEVYLQAIIDGEEVSHLRRVVGRLHISSSDDEVEIAVKTALQPLVEYAKKSKIAENALARCVLLGQKYHAENVKLYTGVMRGTNVRTRSTGPRDERD